MFCPKLGTYEVTTSLDEHSSHLKKVVKLSLAFVRLHMLSGRNSTLVEDLHKSRVLRSLSTISGCGSCGLARQS